MCIRDRPNLIIKLFNGNEGVLKTKALQTVLQIMRQIKEICDDIKHELQVGRTRFSIRFERFHETMQLNEMEAQLPSDGIFGATCKIDSETLRGCVDNSLTNLQNIINTVFNKTHLDGEENQVPTYNNNSEDLKTTVLFTSEILLKWLNAVSYTHLRAHETSLHLV